MCVACFVMSCTGVDGCTQPEGGFDVASDATIVRDYTALLAYPEGNAFRWNALAELGTQVFVTYSFTETPDLPTLDEYAPYEASGYWAFDAAQRASTRLAMAEISRISGVTFVETTGEEAMLQVFGASGSPYGGWANYPSAFSSGSGTGRMVIDQTGTFSAGTTAFQILLHELGHAVGLKHPFQGDVQLAADLDNTNYSVMSYDWAGPAKAQMQSLDIAALEHIYGAARANAGWSWAMDGGVFVLSAAAEDDVIIGVRTSNNLRGQGGSDRLIGNRMDDTLFGGGGDDTLEGGGGRNRLWGGAGRDHLQGSDDGDMLDGGGGNDTLIGGWGVDVMRGQGGRDRLEAGSAADDLRGGAGADTLIGGWGDDTLDGGTGNDRLVGDLEDEGWGNDLLIGGDGNDRLFGGNGNDSLRGDLGNDRLFGGASTDTLDGGVGDDWLDGGSGSDSLNGGDGQDTIYGGESGHKTILGGLGDDVIHAAGRGATFAGWDTIGAGDGHDRVWGYAGSDMITGDAGNDTLHGGDGWDTLLGGDGDDRLFGGNDVDSLDGGAGRDSLSGGDGSDDLFGGAGADTLIGGAGNDDLYGGAGRDRLIGGAGTDYFRFTAQDVGATDVIRDFEIGVDRIVFAGLGYQRADLSLTDTGNGASLLTIGPGGEMRVLLQGVAAADFVTWDVWL